LLLGQIDVDFGFPSIVVTKMAKLPFIPDPRFDDQKDSKFATQDLLKTDTSTTHRAPYPSEKEIGLPRHKMQG